MNVPETIPVLYIIVRQENAHLNPYFAVIPTIVQPDIVNQRWDVSLKTKLVQIQITVRPINVILMFLVAVYSLRTPPVNNPILNVKKLSVIQSKAVLTFLETALLWALSPIKQIVLSLLAM